MAIEVFNRYEYKYVLDQYQFKNIQKHIMLYMDEDAYNSINKGYKIYNLYVDTIDNNMIRTSLAKPKYKQKLRLRSYNKFENSNDIIFIEIKKKVNGLVNKRRSKITYFDAVNFIKTGRIPEIKEYMNVQVLRELEYILMMDSYEIKTEISYSRSAYFNKNDRDLRISFDSNINSTRHENIYFEDNQYLMEIKAESSMPFWLSTYLSKNKIKSSSFSKYGRDFISTISTKKGELS